MKKNYLKTCTFGKNIFLVFFLIFFLCLFIAPILVEKISPAFLESKAKEYMPEGSIFKVKKVNFNWFKDRGTSAEVFLKNDSWGEGIFGNLCLKNSLKDVFLNKNVLLSFEGHAGERLSLAEFYGDFKYSRDSEKNPDGFVDFYVQKISSQYLDNKFFEGKQVVSFLGESLVADGCVKKLFDKKIECIGEVFGETGRAEAHFILENGYMSSVLSKKGKTRVSMTGSSLSNTFSEILPLFNGIKFNKDRIVFELNNYRFPLDGDLELFNGKVKLDLGSIVIESKTSVFNFLDIFETDKQIVLAEIPPVEIDVINGIVKLENFIVDIDKMWKMPFHGTLDLNQKKVDMVSEIDARAVGPNFLGIDAFSKISGVLELGVMVKLKIEGTFDSVRVNLHPEWDPGETALRHIPRLFDEVLKNSEKITDEIEKLGEGLKDIFD